MAAGTQKQSPTVQLASVLLMFREKFSHRNSCCELASQNCCLVRFSIRPTTELYILYWSELSRRKLSPTSASAHYSSSDNAVGLVVQCELSGYVKLG